MHYKRILSTLKAQEKQEKRQIREDENYGAYGEEANVVGKEEVQLSTGAGRDVRFDGAERPRSGGCGERGE